MKRIALTAGLALLAMLAFGCRNAPSTQSGSSSGSSSSTSTSAGSHSESSGMTASSVTPSEVKPSAAQPETTPGPSGATPAASGQEVTLPGGLKFVDLKVGDGDIAEAGLTANVQYTGWLTDGPKFDSSPD